METNAFIDKYWPAAQAVELKYKIPATLTLAQAALETGYGKHAPGNMFFGMKATSNWKGEKQLLQTTEYHNTATVKYPAIISITKQADGTYKYIVKDYFRKYSAPVDSFLDYGAMLKSNSRYAQAFTTKTPVAFAQEVAKHYATDPSYFTKIKNLMATIAQKKNLNLE